jgi:putative ABC transport system permease protein
MIKTDLIIALRNLLKHKRYALTNILGLSVGLASFILIVLWVQDELSYDNFHKDVDNIFVVFRKDNNKLSGATSKLLAPTIKNEIPEIKESTCFMSLPEAFKSLLRYKEQAFSENITLADENFFKVFSFPLLEGDETTAFKNPASLILTEAMKEKFFGKEEALGKTISLTAFGQTKLLEVTGVLKNLPHNSHIQSELILPIDFMKTLGMHWDEWYNQAPSTYIKTIANADIAQLEQKITAVKQKKFKEENIGYSLLPLKKIHLEATNVQFFIAATGDIKYVYIFSAIAVIILLIASMNYMNLSNALSLKRAKEIGVKKTLGGGKTQLIKQYFSETFLMVFISLIVAVLLASLCLPIMNNLSGKILEIPFLSYKFAAIIFTVLFITTLVSGIYPAMFIAGFQPLTILKGKFVANTNSLNIRKGLVVFQFALSAVIIISTIVISRQLRFIQHANLGYDKENLVCVALNNDISNNYEAFKNELLKSGFVSGVSRSNNMDASTLGKTDDVYWPGKQERFSSWIFHVDDEFGTTYGIKMKEGRFFSKDFGSEQLNGFVLNEKAAEEMGFANPLGQELRIWGHEGPIIGVAEDFHFSSLHNTIEPLIMMVPKSEENGMYYRTLTIRLKPNSLPGSMEYLERTWKGFFPDELFDFRFMEDKLNTSYFSEFRMGNLFRYFSLLAIFIACLGLYGLTAFVMEQKNKEIGVYKVFGSSVFSLVYKYSKGYIYWIIIANIIAWPVTYYFMNNWLGNFAYKTGFSIWPFLVSGVVTLLVALFAIGWQTIIAANKNPIDALRYE